MSAKHRCYVIDIAWCLLRDLGASPLDTDGCYLTLVNMRTDPKARKAIVLLLSRGIITVAEARLLAGVSRQLIHGWCRSRGIKPAEARQARIAREWRRGLNNEGS